MDMPFLTELEAEKSNNFYQYDVPHGTIKPKTEN